MLEKGTPLEMLTLEFFANNWANCQSGLLSTSGLVRIWPEPSPSPRMFKFEIDVPFKRKAHPDADVQLRPGPLRGTIYYRADLFVVTDTPAVAVALDRDQAVFHPNYSRQHGFVCLGEIPLGPLELGVLIEHFVYPIVSYQNRRPVHPLDAEAAKYFAFDPEAMEGLEPARPLY